MFHFIVLSNTVMRGFNAGDGGIMFSGRLYCRPSVVHCLHTCPVAWCDVSS